MQTLFKKIISRFIPSTCLLCEIEGEQLICQECTTQFFSSNSQRCASCALPLLPQDTHCGACIKNLPAFDATIVACDYVAPIDQLVLALKFGHRLAIATAMADLLAKRAFHLDLPEFFIATPLSRQRLAQRGFNQAWEIAKPLAQRLKRPVYANVLQRIRDTHAQAQLHPDQRQKNIARAFSPTHQYLDKIRGRHIGVVDDVMTTGATLHEIATCLKRYGAARVTNVVFARTPPH